jgi:hypothetical protein
MKCSPFNALYDFQVADDFVLTIGGGIDVAEARLNVPRSYPRRGSSGYRSDASLRRVPLLRR